MRHVELTHLACFPDHDAEAPSPKGSTAGTDVSEPLAMEALNLPEDSHFIQSAFGHLPRKVILPFTAYIYVHMSLHDFHIHISFKKVEKSIGTFSGLSSSGRWY